MRWLLGATAHPGGESLSRHLLSRLDVPPAACVADIACGDGTTLALLRATGHRPVGVDVEPRAVARARRRGRAVVADAHRLPLSTAACDAVVCECSVSTFADPGQAVREMARLLRSGGRLAMSDVVLRRDLAPPEVVAAVDAVTTARPVSGYSDLLVAAGLRVLAVEDRGGDALALVRRLRRRLTLVGARRAATSARACEQAVRSGALGYAVLLAEKP